MHGIDMCGGTSEENKGDDTSHQGVIIRSKLPHVDGQGGDQINAEQCLANMEELWRIMANPGKNGVAEESSEVNL